VWLRRELQHMSRARNGWLVDGGWQAVASQQEETARALLLSFSLSLLDQVPRVQRGVAWACRLRDRVAGALETP